MSTKTCNIYIYLWNGARYDQYYYDGLIGSHIRAFEWYQNQWPWMTVNGRNALLQKKRDNCEFFVTLYSNYSIKKWCKTETLSHPSTEFSSEFASDRICEIYDYFLKICICKSILFFFRLTLYIRSYYWPVSHHVPQWRRDAHNQHWPHPSGFQQSQAEPSRLLVLVSSELIWVKTYFTQTPPNYIVCRHRQPWVTEVNAEICRSRAEVEAKCRGFFFSSQQKN